MKDTQTQKRVCWSKCENILYTITESAFLSLYRNLQFVDLAQKLICLSFCRVILPLVTRFACAIEREKVKGDLIE